MVNVLEFYTQIKTFIKEERDTVLGLIFFILAALVAIKYIIVPLYEPLGIYALELSTPIVIIIGIIWFYNRKIPIDEDKFTIGIAPLKILIMQAKAELSPEAKRDLKSEMVDYVYSSLHFNKEKLSLDKYLQLIRLPPRIKVDRAEKAKKYAQKLRIDLFIWGEAYHQGEYLYFKPRFEFMREPSNIYYKKFRQKLNQLATFKIKITENVQNQRTELSQLMNYISFIGLMFQGIVLGEKDKFGEAQACLTLALKSMKKETFKNRSLTDIYLATRFFAAQNYHKWGNHLLAQNKKDPKALELFAKGAEAFFSRANEMENLKDVHKTEKLEHSLIYGIYLLTKKGDFKKAEAKLEEIKPQFSKKEMYLYHLYKGLVQRNTKNARPFFDKALKSTTNQKLVFEKIADYYFSKGKTSEAIKYFEKRLKTGDKQTYNPELLEVEAHRHLSEAYAKKAKSISALKQSVIASLNEMKNVTKEKKSL